MTWVFRYWDDGRKKRCPYLVGKGHDKGNMSTDADISLLFSVREASLGCLSEDEDVGSKEYSTPR
jgi:hypothetical protein